MKALDLFMVPFQAGAAARHRRLFHPVGVLAEGTCERLAPPGEGLPVESGGILGRISKGLGTPAALPDFAGLAWRMGPGPFAATPWDVLLVSAGLGSSGSTVNRLLLRPVASWDEAVYSSLMPLRHHGELWWVRARLVPALTGGGMSLAAIRDRIADSGLQFEVEQACGSDEFTPLARLDFSEAVAGEPIADGEGRDVAFDPILHTAPDVTLWPDWLRELREAAYAGSREGRDAD